MTSNSPIIELKNIRKAYKASKYEELVLSELSFAFEKGVVTSILGSSGCGKTTLLNIIGGIDNEFSGELRFKGEAIQDFDKYRRESVSFIFQDLNLINHLDLVKNITIGITNDVVDKEERARELLNRVGLHAHMYKKPHQLSGGERQRVAIARALARDTDVLLCDEPTGSLDETTKEEIMDLIMEVFKGKTIIFITHDEEVAYKYSDMVLTIVDRKIVVKETNVVEENISNTETKQSDSSRDFNKRFQLNLLSKKLGVFNATYILIIITAIFIFGTGIVEKVEQEIDRYLKENNKVDFVRVSTKYTPKGVSEFIEDFNNEYDNLVKGYMLTLNINTRLEGADRTIMNRINSMPPIAKSNFERDIVAGRFPVENNEVLFSKNTAIKMLYEHHVLENTNGYLFKKNKTYDTFRDILNYSDEKLLEEISKVKISYLNTYRHNPKRKYDHDLTVVGILDDEKYLAETTNLVVGHTTKDTIYHVVTSDIYMLDDEFQTYLNSVFLANNEIRFKYFHVITYEEDLDLRKEVFDSLLLFKPILFGRDAVTIQRQNYYDRVYGYKIAIMGGCAILAVFAIISLYNGIRTSIIKNRKNIGIYKSLGYSKGNVKWMFLIEGIIISAYVTCAVFLVWFVINRFLNASIIKALDPAGLLELSNIIHLNVMATIGSMSTIAVVILTSINRELGKIKIIKLLKE